MTLLAAIAVLTNAAFTVAFDDATRCPAWVEYDLEPGEVIVTNRAAIPFRADPRVAASDVGADYLRSGFDRGHMAPAADFNFDRGALEETYLFTNICPQRPTLNRGRWAEIEAEIRRLAADGTVRVLTFPEFEGTNRIGRVRVPSAFVKVAWGNFGVKVWRCENKQ